MKKEDKYISEHRRVIMDTEETSDSPETWGRI